MNRLWVRLSLAYSTIFVLVITGVIIAPSLLLLTIHILTTEQGPMNEPMTGQPMPSTADQFEETLLELLRSSAIGGVIGLIAGVWASRKLSKPIAQLANAAESMRQGDFSQRVANVTWGAELTALATAFNAMAADLEQSEKLRRQLIADVAHELRTPLTVLAGNLNAALDRVYTLTEEEFANLYTQTRHLIGLVNDLHELAQAEARQLPLNLEALDMTQVARETVALFEVLAAEQTVCLRSELAESPLFVRVDGVRIRQVLHNLLSNALLHTPSGGTITLCVQPAIGYIQITIHDTGAGIDPIHLPHLFERFYRADRGRSRTAGGAGLGLAIVKAIVEAHGGQVAATSAGLGQGSAFILILPGLLILKSSE